VKAYSRIHSAAALALLTGAALLAAGVGCESDKNATPTDPAGSRYRIEFLDTAPVVAAGDSASICVRVTTTGSSPRPVAGVTVAFGGIGGRMNGVFTKASDVTDQDGIACGTFMPYPDVTGRTDVKAVAADRDVAYVPVLIVAGGEPTTGPLTVSLHAAETSLPADGTATTQVTVTVKRDGAASPGEQVTLAAGERFLDRDFDGVFSPGDSLLGDSNANGEWDAIGSVTSSVTTGTGGSAVATYTAGDRTSTVYIKATVDSVATDLAIELHGDEAQIAVELTNSELLANGFATSTITVLVTDSDDNPIQGKLVRFTAGEPFADVDGNGYYTSGVDTFTDLNDNELWDPMGQVTPSAANTNQEGEAQAVFLAGREAGDVTLYISTRDQNLKVKLTLIEPPPVVSGTWSWDPPSVAAIGSSGAVLSLTLYDINGSTIAGKRVNFTVSAGTIDDHAYANQHGVVQALYMPPTTPGTYTVLASVNGWSAQIPVDVLPFEQVVRRIEFKATPPSLWVLGVGKDDHALLEATCYYAGDIPAPAGIPVIFTLMSNLGGGETLIDSLGTPDIDQMTVKTDSSGVARVVLRAGTLSGPFEIQAEAGDASEILRLGISSGPATGMYCSRVRSEDDPRDWFVTATVHDAYHNPVPDGTIVVFSADHGLIATGNGTGSTHTVAGKAEATFTTYALFGVATIRAACDGGVFCEFELDLATHAEEPGPIAFIELTASPSEIAVDSTGGVTQALLTAQCYDAVGQAVGRGRGISFRIMAGPNGGENIALQGYGPVTAVTDDYGRAKTILMAGFKSGTVKVLATADSAQAAGATLVGMTAGPPYYIAIGADPLNIRGWDLVGAQSDLWAYVYDRYGNPVREKTEIWAYCDEGMVRGDYINQGQIGSSRTEGGVAVFTYFSGLPRQDGIVEITASTSGGEVTGSATVISSGPPYSVEFISPAGPVSVWADGADNFTFYVEVLDINQNYVLAGETVEFSTNYGTVPTSVFTANGTTGSIAKGIFTSEVLDRDASVTTPDDGIGAVAHVRASAGLGGVASDVLDVSMLTGAAYVDNCTFTIDSSVPRNESAPFRVVIKDRYGNPLGGHVLAAAASDGDVTTPVITNMWGEGNFLFTAPADSGDVRIVVTDTDPNYGGISLSEETTAD
jgi:hypothetical protein